MRQDNPWLDRKRLLILRKELNDKWLADGEPPIKSLNNKGIRQEIKAFVQGMRKHFPDEWKAQLPYEAVYLYEVMTTDPKPEKRFFLRVPQWFIDEGFVDKNSPVGLTAAEFLVLSVIARFANFGKEENQEGMAFGETFVGREKVAELTGYSLPTVDRLVASLVEKGHLINVDEKRTDTRRVRAVAFMLSSKDDFQ